MTSANDLIYSPSPFPLDISSFEGCRELTTFTLSWPFFSSDCLGCLQPASLALGRYEHIWATEAGLKGFISLFFFTDRTFFNLLTFQVKEREQGPVLAPTSVEADLQQVQWASVPNRQVRLPQHCPLEAGYREACSYKIRPTFSDLFEQKERGVQHLTVCLSSTPARKCLFASNWP